MKIWIILLTALFACPLNAGVLQFTKVYTSNHMELDQDGIFRKPFEITYSYTPSDHEGTSAENGTVAVPQYKRERGFSYLVRSLTELNSKLALRDVLVKLPFPLLFKKRRLEKLNYDIREKGFEFAIFRLTHLKQKKAAVEHLNQGEFEEFKRGYVYSNRGRAESLNSSRGSL